MLPRPRPPPSASRSACTLALALALFLTLTHHAPGTGQDLTRKSSQEAARYKFCSLCANHDNSLPLFPAFKLPAALAAPPEEKLRVMFADPAAAKLLDSTCPLRPSLSNRLYSGTVRRRRPHDAATAHPHA